MTKFRTYVRKEEEEGGIVELVHKDDVIANYPNHGSEFLHIYNFIGELSHTTPKNFSNCHFIRMPT